MKIKDVIRILYKKVIPRQRRMKIRKIRKAKQTGVSKKDSDIYFEKLTFAVELLKNSRSADQALEPLHNAFKARKVRSKLLNNDWWTDFVTAASMFDKEGEKIQERLINEVKTISNNLFEHWELLHIYSLSVRVGLLVVGYALRVKSREVAIDYLKRKKHLDIYKLRSSLSALLESGKEMEYNNFIKLLTKKHEREKKLFTHLYNIFCDNERINSNDPILIATADDQLFGKLIKGKKIAIVGPAKTDNPDGESIDSYDLVVRCNYKEKGVGVDAKIKGKRCDLTYFNFEQTRYFCKQKEINWPDDILWAVCKSKNGAKMIKEKINNISDTKTNTLFNTRYIENLKDTLFMNTFNAVSNIVMDLLRFDPKEIKIFHADMMLTVARSTGYYPLSWARENNMERTFLEFSSRSHDLVIQYWLLYTLFKKGRIKGDKRFDEVMELGEKKYMQQLQYIYGNSGRIIEIR